MALPKRRHSKTRGKKRRANDALSVPSLVPCPSCGQMKLPHRVCPNCRKYKGREVIKEKVKKEKKKK